MPGTVTPARLMADEDIAGLQLVAVGAVRRRFDDPPIPSSSQHVTNLGHAVTVGLRWCDTPESVGGLSYGPYCIPTQPREKAYAMNNPLYGRKKVKAGDAFAEIHKGETSVLDLQGGSRRRGRCHGRSRPIMGSQWR